MNNENIVIQEPKKNGNKVLIILLVLLVLGMGGYITYDKVLKDKLFTTKDPKENDNKTDDNKKDNNTTKENKNDNNSKYAKEVNYEFTLDGNTNKVSLKYILHESEAWGYVVESDIYINNKKINDNEIFWGHAETKEEFESTEYKNTLAKSTKLKGKDGKEYYVLFYGILGGGATGDHLYIIDNQGEVIDSITDCGYYYYESTNEEYGNTGFYSVRDNTIVYPEYIEGEGKCKEKIITIENGKTTVSDGNIIDDLTVAGQC